MRRGVGMDQGTPATLLVMRVNEPDAVTPQMAQAAKSHLKRLTSGPVMRTASRDSVTLTDPKENIRVSKPFQPKFSSIATLAPGTVRVDRSARRLAQINAGWTTRTSPGRSGGDEWKTDAKFLLTRKAKRSVRFAGLDSGEKAVKKLKLDHPAPLLGTCKHAGFGLHEDSDSDDLECSFDEEEENSLGRMRLVTFVHSTGPLPMRMNTLVPTERAPQHENTTPAGPGHAGGKRSPPRSSLCRAHMTSSADYREMENVLTPTDSSKSVLDMPPGFTTPTDEQQSKQAGVDGFWTRMRSRKATGQGKLFRPSSTLEAEPLDTPPNTDDQPTLEIAVERAKTKITKLLNVPWTQMSSNSLKAYKSGERMDRPAAPPAPKKKVFKPNFNSMASIPTGFEKSMQTPMFPYVALARVKPGFM